jgi:spore coat protein U-like protein
MKCDPFGTFLTRDYYHFVKKLTLLDEIDVYSGFKTPLCMAFKRGTHIAQSPTPTLIEYLAMFSQKALLAAALFAAMGVASTASANTTTGTFTVSLTVNKACTVTTSASSNIAFSAVNAGGTATSGNGSFSVNCSNGTPFYVGLAPQNVASTTGAGTMKGSIGGNNSTVTYQLYQNSGLSNVWGNTATSTSAGNGLGGTGGGMSASKAVSETVYAAVTGSTDVTPDTYSDTVTINVNF